MAALCPFARVERVCETSKMKRKTERKSVRYPYTPARVSALRHQLKTSRGWSLPRFASELGISPSYVRALERGERPITANVNARLERLELDAAFVAKEIERTDAKLLEWLIVSIEQRAGRLTGRVRRRLRKLLE